MQNIDYTVGRRKKVKHILCGVTGYFDNGSMVALMGPSGSGKTSLLDILAGRKNSGVIKGTVTIGGRKPTHAFLRRFTAYVEQFDSLIANLTVYEMLLYTADLKLDRKESMAVKRGRVEAVLTALSLQGCRDSLIGSALHRGISGGQLKRWGLCTLAFWFCEPVSYAFF